MHQRMYPASGTVRTSDGLLSSLCWSLRSAQCRQEYVYGLCYRLGYRKI